MPANEPNSTTTPAITDDTQSNADAADRRSFLKGAVIVAGAAATGVFAAAPGAEAAIRPRAHATVRLGFDAASRFSAKELHAAIDEALGHAGCPTCGLVGFDIRLETVIPLKSDVVAHIVLEEGQFLR